MTTLSLTHEDVAKLLDNLAPQLGQLEARAREFAQRIGTASELRKQAQLAAQYAAHDAAVMNKQNRYTELCIELAGSVVNAELIMAHIAEADDWRDAIATQEAARP